MTKWMRRVVSCLLLTVLCGATVLSACKKKETENTQVELWTTYNTQKICKDGKEYDDVKFEPAISLTMAQGEYEGAQLIMSPKTDVAWYNASISDLKNVETGEVYSKDRVVIYKQEYVYIASITQAVDGNKPGYYPDALIPLHAVVAYEENKITAGDNQGLYFRFSTRPELDENGDAIVKNANETEDAKRYSYVSSGTYTGTITLDFKTHTQTVPVTLTIIDATVSETAHAKTRFGTWDDGLMVNMNWTQEGVEQWNDTLLEYRMSGTNALNDNVYSEKVQQPLVDAVWERISNPRCSGWSISPARSKYEDNFIYSEESGMTTNAWAVFTPEEYLEIFSLDNPFYVQSFKTPEEAALHRSKFVYVDGDGNEYAYDPSLEGVNAFYVTSIYRTLWLYIEKCLENDVNLLDKLHYGIAHIDEAWRHNGHEAVRACTTLYKAALITLAEMLTEEEDPTYKVWSRDVTLKFSESTVTKEEILQSILRFKLVFTGEYAENYQGLIETWCPTSNYYGSEYARENYYAQQEEKWWYPMDDAPGISPTIETSALYSRVAGWMMADYDITGLLYWGINCFYDRNEGNSPIDDYFTTNYLRTSGSNGNGFFFYPGAQYELDEMIPSWRAEALRDGLEEWELFYNIKNTYSEISEKIGLDFDASKIIESLGTTLYAQDKIINDNEAFATARTSLLQLASCAESGANMCIVDYNDNTYGTQNYKIFANEGVSITNNGEALTNVYQTIAGVGKVYSVDIPLTKEENSLHLSYTCDGVSYEYAQNLGGSVKKYSVGSDIKAADFAETSNVSFSSTLVNEIEGKSGNAIKISVGASNETALDEKIQYFRFTNAFFNTDLQSAKKIIIHLYNTQTEDLSISVYCRQKGVMQLRKLMDTTLPTGETQLVLTMPSIDWEKNGIEYFDFCIGEGATAETAKTLYVKDVVIYKK